MAGAPPGGDDDAAGAGAGASAPTAPADPAPEASAAVAHRRATALEARGELNRAFRAYEAALRVDPVPLRTVLRYVALGLELWRDDEVAPRLRERAASAAPSDRVPLRALASLVDQERRTADPGARWGTFRELRTEDPSSPWPWLVLVRRGARVDGDGISSDSVRALLDACLALDPGFPPCLLGRGTFLLDAGELRAAARDLGAAARAEDWEIHRHAATVRLARALVRAGRPDSVRILLARRPEEGAPAGPWTRYRREGLRYGLAGTLREDASHDGPPGPDDLRRISEDLTRAVHALPQGMARSQGVTALAGMANRAGDPEEAHRLLLRSLRSAPPENVRWRASRSLEACRIAWRLGRPEEALPRCLASLGTFRTTGDAREALSAAHVTSHLFAETGRLEEARAFAAEHLELAERAGWGGDRVSALHDLGWILWRLGRREAARDLLGRMAALAEADGRWLYEAASFHETLGEYETALRLYHRGVADVRTSATGPYGNYPRSLFGLSRLYLRTGRPARALDYARAYEAYVRRMGAFDLPLPNLPEVYRALGRHEDAIREARGWLEEVRASSAAAAHLSRARRELATSYLAAGRPADALPLLRALLEEGEAIGDAGERIELRLALADALLRLGRPEAAGPPLAAAGDRARALRDPEMEWRVATLRGRRLEAMGEPGRALEAYEEAIRRLERTRARLAGPDLRSGFLADRLAPYEAALRLQTLRTSPDAGPPDIEAAFRLSEKKKARTLLELVGGERGDRSAEAPGPLLAEKARVAERLSALRDRLAAAEDADATSGAPSLVRLRSEADSLALRYDALLQGLRRAAPRLSAADGLGEPISLTDLRRELGDGVLVEYASTGDRLLAFVIGPDRAEVRELPLDLPEAERLVEELREPLEALRRGEVGLAHVRWDLDAARHLYRGLVAPLEDFLAGADELVVVPEGPLWELPFEALVTDGDGSGRGREGDAGTTAGGRADPAAGGRADSPAGGRAVPAAGDAPSPLLFGEYARVEYLLDRWVVSYAPSATLLRRDLWRRGARGEGFLLVGSPAAEGGADGGLASATRVSGEAATEERVLREAGRYRWLHFATHGVADRDHPERSALLLGTEGSTDATKGGGAGPSSVAGSSDGRLEAWEIAGLRLSADLVTLGACETGVGPTRAGEGSLALTRAFMVAGVPSVVASLWAVPAQADRIWPAFYRTLRDGDATPGGKARALRQAKLALRESSFLAPDGTRVSLAHPVFWAPYVLVGRF